MKIIYSHHKCLATTPGKTRETFHVESNGDGGRTGSVENDGVRDILLLIILVVLFAYFWSIERAPDTVLDSGEQLLQGTCQQRDNGFAISSILTPNHQLLGLVYDPDLQSPHPFHFDFLFIVLTIIVLIRYFCGLLCTVRRRSYQPCLGHIE